MSQIIMLTEEAIDAFDLPSKLNKTRDELVAMIESDRATNYIRMVHLSEG